MIKIFKGPPPATLQLRSLELTNANKIEFDKFPTEYSDGLKFFTFTDAYKTEEVINALNLCQHNKCCFSEAKFSGDYRNVEHFRPKGRVDELGTNSPSYPGYYWLAYEWSNLFICKQLINVSCKRNYFPLTNEGNRNRNHHQTNHEEPVLIDPTIDEPREHLSFSEDEIVYKSDRGRQTIKILGLRQSDIAEDRRTHFQFLKQMKLLVDIAIAEGYDKNHAMISNPIKILKESIHPSAKFSSMAIDLLSNWPHLQ